MANLISLIIGLVLLIPAVIAFVPLFGWLYWAIVPLALIGLLIGLVSRGGRGGVILNAIIVAVGMFRLMIFGGIL